MSRPVKQPTWRNSQQQRALHHKFLHILHAACPEVFNRLRKDVEVRRREMRELMKALPGWRADDLDTLDSVVKRKAVAPVVEHWARDFNLSGTWIEEDAQQLGAIWISQEGESTKYLPLTFSGETESPGFQEIVLRIPIPFGFQAERPYFSWDRLREFLLSQIPTALDAEIGRMRSDQIESGSSVESILPSGMEQRMAVTALYLFRGLTPDQIRVLPVPSYTPGKVDDQMELRRTPEEIRDHIFSGFTLQEVKDLLGSTELRWEDRLLIGLARERTVLNRWIREITELLDLDEVRRHRIISQRRAGRTRPRV